MRLRQLERTLTITRVKSEDLVDKTDGRVNLLLTMRENLLAVCRGSSGELLESKHLFQSVHVKTEHLLKELPKKKRISRKLPPNARLLASMFNEMPRGTRVWTTPALKIDFLPAMASCRFQPPHLAGGWSPTSEVTLPKIRIPCGQCSAVKPLHLPSTNGNPLAAPYRSSWGKN